MADSPATPVAAESRSPARADVERVLIEVDNLSKSYGAVRAVDGISFQVREGEILGFLGPNGAGKTTTLRILAGYLPGDRGTVRVAGHDVQKESLAVRQVIGYLPEGVPLYPEMRVVEYLRFRSRLKGVPWGDRKRLIDESLEATGTQDVRRRVIGTLSRGYRQRVGLADALLGRPRVLILDEPTVGLDPEQVRQFRSLLKEVGRDRTVILSTHILSEVELVCSSVVIIANGKIAARDSAANLRSVASERGSCTVVELTGASDAVKAALEALPGVSKVERATPAGADGDTSGAGDYQRLKVFSAADSDVREAVFRAAAANDWVIRHLEREVLSLEDVFLEIVGRKP